MVASGVADEDSGPWEQAQVGTSVRAGTPPRHQRPSMPGLVRAAVRL